MLRHRSGAWRFSGIRNAALVFLAVVSAPVSGQPALGIVESALPAVRNGSSRAAALSWTLQTVRGDLVSLEQFEGKVLFINMWATWCAPCVQELNSILALRESLAGTEVEFLLISPEEPRRVTRFLQQFRQYESLPVYLEYERMPEVFGLEALPTTYIIDRDGKITYCCVERRTGTREQRGNY